MSAARGMSKSKAGLQCYQSGGTGNTGRNREDGDQQSGLDIQNSEMDQRGIS